MRRRDFIRSAGLGIAAASSGFAAARQGVSLVVNSRNRLTAEAPVQWAMQELERALIARDVLVGRSETFLEAPESNLCIAIGGVVPGAEKFEAPDSLAFGQGNASFRRVVYAGGVDARGLMYALLELAERARHGVDPLAAMAIERPGVERPANEVRSVARLFTSDVEDNPWFNDREMWPAYFSMLAANRFNRFHLALGIGYDFLRDVSDAYFVFAYPFFLNVPGYNVRATNVPDAERDRNLEMLKFISDQSAAHGIDFQLGLWTHGYQWTNSPHAHQTIEGLTPETHAPYCRDALAALLKACPKISGVTFRIHGESGVAEGSYSFWQAVFEGIVKSGRKIEIDMHAKGIDQRMIDVGLATGMPVKVSPKYCAEHMSLPYLPAAIREQEMPQESRNAQGFFALSSGSRSFTRYGYADLLQEDRRYGVIHRMWPGTQRLLLWGDPAFAAAYSRAFHFCGTNGADLMEPLSFKGRRGSGLAGHRSAYADLTLRPRWDWQKYLYSYRLWGRMMYSPETDPEVWRRSLRAQYRDSAQAVETSLSAASRILPVITTAHGPSAANNNYWPEIYTNQPVADATKRHQYGDTAAPKVFTNASPFDPQLFSRMNEFADELLKGERSGKYSPVDVAQWIEDLAFAATTRLPGGDGAEIRRVVEDVRIQAGLGRFFGAKLRCGVLYAIHERTGDRAALEEAVKLYRKARAAWSEMATRAAKVYVADITVGENPWLRGSWLDRLPAIDEDIADLEKHLAASPVKESPDASRAIREALSRPRRETADCRHTPPGRFHAGRAVDLELSAAPEVSRAVLCYRHVNQAERYERLTMTRDGRAYRASIPIIYTASRFPLQYYFELRKGPAQAWIYPGFAPDLANQPYFVIHEGAR